jgi:dihydrofolate reductase
MTLAIVAAIGKNRVIGQDGKLPWHISEDLKRFKKLTSGHTVLMGRKTFESIGKPLSNRRNVVISSKHIPNVETYPSIEAALTALADQDKVFIIGGGQIYAQLLDRADELYLTLVDKRVEGDAFFPPYEHLIGKRFVLVRQEAHGGFAFVDYARLKGSAVAA